MTSKAFAAMHGRKYIWELARYLRAGCDAEDLGELVTEICIALESTNAESLRGGRS